MTLLLGNTQQRSSH